ncbi:MAG: hypothetical protein HN919_07255 [Verrucomicrobia bacterium]|jgi:hypothetical protein|nr:hypothetical protein [Verrucomicrobiota bacterium]MBT7066083.1 hypothetical protein [Verrucomicrobiota bacterium]MBT7700293.1 hypothetical protein [Verrucomicrobiota bacterium]
MVVIGLIAALWAVILAAVARIVAGNFDAAVMRKGYAGVVLLLLALASIAYFRPHEDVFGGQDQGAYINAAVTFARTKTLKHVDPLLDVVPEAQRTGFHYRSSLSGLPTLAHVLRLEAVDSARQVPWFQPSFSLILALPALCGWSDGVLYVSPLLTLLIALALWGLAHQLWAGRSAGLIAAATFLASPLLLWHGRNARAELPALLFLVCGASLLLQAIRPRPGRRSWDWALAGLCFGLAPLSHITAAPMSLLAGLVLLVLIRRGHRHGWLALAFLVAMALLFVGQTLWITDPYGLAGALRVCGQHSGLWIVLLGAITVGAAMLALPLPLAVAVARRTWLVPALQWGLAIVGVGWLFAVARIGPNRLFGAGSALRIVGLADLAGFVEIAGPAAAICMLLGWLVLVLGSGAGWARRVAVAVILLPCATLGGVISSGLLYGSRYMLIAIAPLAALSLVGLFMWLQSWSCRCRWCRWCLTGFVALACLWGVYAQRPLLFERDYPGLNAFIRRVAAPMRGGLVLCEYSRVAAPLKYLAGLDLLGIDSETQRDYTAIEIGWAGIMVAHPGRAAYFVTPYATPPLSERFTFEPKGIFTYSGARLRSGASEVDAASSPLTKQLHVYRMHPPTPPANPTQPFTRAIPPISSMGLRRFHDNRMVGPNQRGIVVPVRPAPPLRIGALSSPSAPVRIGLVLVSDTAPCLTDATAAPIQVLPLQPPWWLAVADQTTLAEGLSSAPAGPAVRLVDVWKLGATPQPLTNWADGLELQAVDLPSTPGRWMAQGAEILLPERASGTLFALLIKVRSADDAVDPRLRLTVAGGGSRVFALDPASGAMRWYFVNSENGKESDLDYRWVRMAMRPPYRVRIGRSMGARVGVLAAACSLPLTTEP